MNGELPPPTHSHPRDSRTAFDSGDLCVSFSSPSMDEAATKEELRPVKKQLVSCLLFIIVLGEWSF